MRVCVRRPSLNVIRFYRFYVKPDMHALWILPSLHISTYLLVGVHDLVDISFCNSVTNQKLIIVVRDPMYERKQIHSFFGKNQYI